ncbi:MAG: serine/threonine protein kinase [Anaerostipes sp.]|nr:serine/threonine protein kinase [Anaerostipes sp.]
MSGILAVSALPAIPAHAAGKKLSVNKVYDTATAVKGKTKRKYQVRIQIGKMTYKSTASKKGNYSVKIPKQAAGKTLTVKSYWKKGKKWKAYTKKKVYVLAKTISVKKFYKSSKYIKGYVRPKYKVKVIMNGKTYTKKAGSRNGYFSVKMKKAAGTATAKIKVYNAKGKFLKSYKRKAYDASPRAAYYQDGKPYTGKLPGLSDPIDLEGFDKKVNSASKFADHSIYSGVDIAKRYSMVYYGKGAGKYGYTYHYLDQSNNEEKIWFCAKNGVTLYYKVFKSENLKNTPTPGPSNCDGIIKSGCSEQFIPERKDPKKHTASLPIKIVGYKNGKPVMASYYCLRLNGAY